MTNSSDSKILWQGESQPVKIIKQERSANPTSRPVTYEVCIQKVCVNENNNPYVVAIDRKTHAEIVFTSNDFDDSAVIVDNTSMTLNDWCRHALKINPYTAASAQLSKIIHLTAPGNTEDFTALIHKLNTADVGTEAVQHHGYSYEIDVPIEFRFGVYLHERKIGADLTEEDGFGILIKILDDMIEDFDDYMVSEIEYLEEYESDPGWTTYAKLLNEELQQYAVSVIFFNDGSSEFYLFPVKNEDLNTTLSLSIPHIDLTQF